jgi:eukaryotic-like serine/threonine-protein kinase
MDAERWQQIKQLYNSALELEPDRREAFLDEACAGDESLRKEIERLLARQAEGERVLGKPALEFAARAMAQDHEDEPLPDYIGRSLLHYRITEKIGEGGMGIVYKARDTHLDRTVAIKVLPAAAVADPERKRRFIQEAKAASALNHPNIIDIHDINSDAGVDFIVMEHVPGKTLDRRIGRKGLRVGEALKYAVQIADALAAAHAAGIVHRDLKPVNIMVTETGLIKVLDFGLAKLTQPLQSEVTGTVPSMESMTGEGRIMGTVAYMSPEQAEGKPVDARSDIFSFGSVLYEMLTGKKPFQGDSTISTLSAIIERDPPPLSADIPHDLERIVTRCLRKDPARRFQSMADLKVELEELKEAAESGRLKVVAAVAKSVSPVRLAIIALAVIVLIAAGWYWLGRGRSTEPEAVLTPVPLTSYPGYEYTPSFSPDGNQVAFEWCTEQPGSNCDIYIKQVGVEPPSRLTTDPAEDCSPAWSPDGNSIAFLRILTSTRAALLMIPQRGGQERVLGETNYVKMWQHSLAWTPDSKGLAFQDTAGPGLFFLSVQTGERRRLTDNGEDNRPAFSPDGRTLAFGRLPEIYLLRLTEGYLPQGVPERLTSSDDDWCAVAWTPDGSELLFSHTAWASSGLWRMAASGSASPRKLPLASEDFGRWPAVSRHGNRLAYMVDREDPNIWRVDMREPGLEPGAPVPLISSTKRDAGPAYSPDGKRIAFASTRSGAHEVWVCNSDGSNAVQLTTSGNVGNPPGWSPDGRTVAYTVFDGRYQSVHLVSANGGVPRRLTTGPFVDKVATFSRDGQSIYFPSNRSGTYQIWKVLAGGGDPVQITPNGEERDFPRESPDGKFIYFQKRGPTQCSVWKMPAGGGEETVVLDSVQCGGQWAYWKERIYFFRPMDAKGHSDICRYEFGTGQTSKVLTIEKPISHYIAASPDGRTILYTQHDQTGTDLMLVENFR